MAGYKTGVFSILLPVAVRYGDKDEDEEAVVELINEYFQWMDSEMKSKMHVDLPKSLFKEIHSSLYMFQRPEGRLLVAEETEQRKLVGTAGLRSIDSEIGEVKRMYLKPEARGKGVGGKMLDKLISDANEMDLSILRLESGPFMTKAHALYRSRGFRERDYYKEAECPKIFSRRWLFFEREI